MFGKVVFALFAVAVLVTVVLYTNQRQQDITKNSDQGIDHDKTEAKKMPSLSHKNYGVGLMKRSCKAANLCNPSVRYPINNIDVDYGSKFPNGCGCAVFLTPP